jgi:DNA-binding NarL/FixJ family response regulator
MRTSIDDFRPAQDDSGLPLFASARASDPETSKAAARSVTPVARRSDPNTSLAAGRNAEESGLISRHEQIILDALAAGPGSKDEIAARCSLTEQQVIRRRAAMLRKGLVTVTDRVALTPGGQPSEVWRLT